MISAEASKCLFENTTKAFEEIVREISDVSIARTDSFIISSPEVLSVIVGSLGVHGRILLTTTYEAAKNIARFMNFGDPIENRDEIFMYFAEFANMYCGRSATYMNDKFGARTVWISPPAIFAAEDLEIISPNLVTQKAYYKADFGSFIIDIGIVDDEESDFGFC